MNRSSRFNNASARIGQQIITTVIIRNNPFGSWIHHRARTPITRMTVAEVAAAAKHNRSYCYPEIYQPSGYEAILLRFKPLEG